MNSECSDGNDRSHNVVSDLQRSIEEIARIPAPTGQERYRVEFLLARMTDIPHRVDAAGNLWVFPLGEQSWSETVVFDAHLDVVGPGHAESVAVQNGRLYGQGVADNVAAVAMLSRLAREVFHGTVVSRVPLAIVFTVGEERLGNLKGMRQVVADHDRHPRLLVAWDLSLDTCSTSGVGSRRYTLRCQGEGGHSWNDFGKPNAIHGTLELLSGIREALADLAERVSDTLSFNIGTISGGDGVNSLAREAHALYEVRSVSPDALAEADRLIAGIISSRSGMLHVNHTCVGNRAAASATLDEATVERIRFVFRRIGVTINDTPRSTNINARLAAGWPAVCLGCCRCGNIHRSDEFLELSSLAEGWAVMTDLLSDSW